jgi:hypothetical protein
MKLSSRLCSHKPTNNSSSSDVLRSQRKIRPHGWLTVYVAIEFSFFCALCPSYKLAAQPCGPDCWSGEIVVREDVGSAQITVTRRSKFDRPFSVTYGTRDLAPASDYPFIARAGEDYLQASGVATFAIGQTNLSFTVPILNNSKVNERRLFEVCVSSSDQNVVPSASHLLEIQDDESPENALELDPSFAPELRPAFGEEQLLGGGGILVDAGPLGRVPLRVDGSLGEASRYPLEYTLLAELPDGRFWGAGPSGEFAVLSPDFSIRSRFHLPHPIAKVLTVQPDGKVLCLIHFMNIYRLARFQQDGSLDQAFQPAQVSGWTSPRADLLPDNKILLNGLYVINSETNAQPLVRFNSNGTIDRNFKCDFRDSPLEFAYVERAFPLRSGKILVNGNFLALNSNSDLVDSGWARLNEDGSLDRTFKLVEASSQYLAQEIYEFGDGKLLILASKTGAALGIPESRFRFRSLVLIRVDTDGTIEKVLGRIDYASLATHGMDEPWAGVKFAKDGDLFLFSLFESVNGYPRAGQARFFPREIGQKFFAQPLGLTRGGNAIGLKIRRSGETSAAAFVKFATRDGSAIQNKDYSPIGGVLSFSPGEGCKDLVIPLHPNRARETLNCYLDLSEPTEPYSATPKTTIRIPPPLYMELRPKSDRAAAFFILRGVPALSVVGIESSENLRDWFEFWMGDIWANLSARDPAETISGYLPPDRPADFGALFFRAARQ